MVKILDGRALNGHWWVFYGALSNVGYTITISDLFTGRSRTYVNPIGRFASVGDILALPDAVPDAETTAEPRTRTAGAAAENC